MSFPPSLKLLLRKLEIIQPILNCAREAYTELIADLFQLCKWMIQLNGCSCSILAKARPVL